jgi:hypothetical protein
MIGRGMDQRLITTGRVARGALAISAIATAGLGALLIATFRCCGSPSLAQTLTNPAFWGLIVAMPVAIAALPPVSRRLRGTAVRWLLLPPVLIDIVLCGWLGLLAGRQMTEGSVGEALLFLLPVMLPNAICGVYVLARVVLPSKA